MLPSRSPDAPQSVLRWRPQSETLAKFHRSQEFVRGVIGPLGSGKTFSCILEMLDCIHQMPPNKDGVRESRWCVARNSFPDLHSATIPDFRSVVDRLPFGKFTNGTVPTWTAEYRRQDGTTVRTTVLFRSFDQPGDVRKARGMQLSGVWIDELGEFSKANFDMLVGRVKRFPARSAFAPGVRGRFRVLSSSNAVARDHWMAQLALQDTPPGYAFFIQPGAVMRVGGRWIVNPKADNLQNLDPDYYLHQLGGKKESWIRQNLANEFVHHGDGRAVHPDFNEVLHTAQNLEPTPGLPLYLGIDFGRTPAAVIGQRQANGQWLILRELVSQNMGADKFGRLLSKFLAAHYQGFEFEDMTGDPSGSSGTQSSDDTAFDMLLEHGKLEVYPAYTNDFEVRVATLDGLLTQLIEGQPAVLVDALRCPTVVAGLAGQYQFRRVQVAGEERFHDKPDKGPTSHAVEACHYMLMGAGESAFGSFDHAGNTEYDYQALAQPVPDSVFE